MSLIMKFLGATPTPSRNADDDRWWSGAASQSVAGVNVDADTALKISTAWACVTLLSETIASLPLVIYRLRQDSGRERARNHPLYGLLHDQPNGFQTAAEFREMMTGHVLLRGNAYAQIVPGARGAVDQLLPIHPDRVKVEKLPNGRFRYNIQQDDNTKRPYNQEDILHLKGPSKDGITGMSVIEYAVESMGMALAAERFGARFFRNDSRPGGALTSPGKLSKEAAQRLKSSWEAAHTGGNQHRVAVLEEGLTWQQIGISPDQAQFLQTREFQAEDICRWFRVPPHMVGLTSKATSWGSGIEQMSMGFVTYTLLPWLTRWTQTITRDLILAPRTYFPEFIVEGLLRGDTNSRYSAYAIARQWGWMSVNEIRQKENMNAVDNGDVYLQPMNMEEAGETGDLIEGVGETAVSPHYRLLAEESAGRLIRKELNALARINKKHTEGEEGWKTAVSTFYTDHVALVAQTMQMPLPQAKRYCDQQQNELLTQGSAAANDWATRRAAYLASIAIYKDPLQTIKRIADNSPFNEDAKNG